MKIRSLCGAAALGTAVLRLAAQTPEQYQPSYSPPYQGPPGYQTQYAPPSTSAPTLDSAQLDQLLAPVALYPDPVLGAIIPASTRPSEVSAAASLMASNADPSTIAQQPWDDSVKALAQYRDVVQWMAQNEDWTNQLGTAVALLQPDVLNSIQRLRANALRSGLLATNAQQQVMVNNNVISIVPAQPNVVYVPTYDPQYVFEPSYSGPPPVVRYGDSYPIGLVAGLAFGIDWLGHSVWFDHERGDDHDWRRIANAPTHQEWRPSQNFRRNQYPVYTAPHQFQIARPTPYSEHVSRWSQPTRTPGLVPTGPTYAPPGRTYMEQPRGRTYAQPTRPQVRRDRDNKPNQDANPPQSDEDRNRRRRDRDDDDRPPDK